MSRGLNEVRLLDHWHFTGCFHQVTQLQTCVNPQAKGRMSGKVIQRSSGLPLPPQAQTTRPSGGRMPLPFKGWGHCHSFKLPGGHHPEPWAPAMYHCYIGSDKMCPQWSVLLTQVSCLYNKHGPSYPFLVK